MRKEGKCECVPGFLDAKGQTNCIVAPSSKECEPY